MQLMWLNTIDWNDNILPQVLKCWQNFINYYTILYWINYAPNALVEIHCFCNASEFAYAAVIYYTRIEIEGNIFNNLLVAETKVAAIKKTVNPLLGTMWVHPTP